MAGTEFSVENARQAFLREGFFIASCLFDADQVDRAKQALRHAITAEAPYRRSDIDDESQVVFCPYYDDLFLHMLQGPVFDLADSLLGRDSILYHYGSSCIRPGSGNFSSRIHVERNYFTGDYLEGIGVLILLSDFSEENGATLFLPASHLSKTKPEEPLFRLKSVRLVAPAGSVFFFHPHLWHAGGVNKTATTREALTLGFCRAYLKQRLDIPSLMAERILTLEDRQLRQKLGVNASPPRSLAEFYSRQGGWQSGKG